MTLTEHEVTYSLEEGDEITFSHLDEEIRLTPDAPTATRPCLRWSAT